MEWTIVWFIDEWEWINNENICEWNHAPHMHAALPLIIFLFILYSSLSGLLIHINSFAAGADRVMGRRPLFSTKPLILLSLYFSSSLIDSLFFNE